MHGIGNFLPGSVPKNTFAKYLDCSPDDIVEFSYEPLFDAEVRQRWWFKVLVSAATIALNSQSRWLSSGATVISDVLEDYIGDIVSYFFNTELRAEIQVELQRCLEAHPSAIILAHSLGSIVAIETIDRMGLKANNHVLVLTGCPVGSNIIGYFVRQAMQVKPSAQLHCQATLNLWGRLDPLSGMLQGYSILTENQLKTNLTHNWTAYIRAAGNYLKSKNITI